MDKLHEENKFIRELEKDYILISADEVRREYDLRKPREIEIILRNDECGGTKYLNMNLDRSDFEKVVAKTESEGCLFGIWKGSVN